MTRSPAGRWILTPLAILFMTGQSGWSQTRPADPPPYADDERSGLGRSLNFTEQLLARKIDEQMLFQALSELALVEKVRYTGPPPRVAKNPTAPGAKNPVVITAYTFLPKKYMTGQKIPLMLFA